MCTFYGLKAVKTEKPRSAFSKNVISRSEAVKSKQRLRLCVSYCNRDFVENDTARDRSLKQKNKSRCNKWHLQALWGANFYILSSDSGLATTDTIINLMDSFIST